MQPAPTSSTPAIAFGFVILALCYVILLLTLFQRFMTKVLALLSGTCCKVVNQEEAMAIQGIVQIDCVPLLEDLLAL